MSKIAAQTLFQPCVVEMNETVAAGRERVVAQHRDQNGRDVGMKACNGNWIARPDNRAEIIRHIGAAVRCLGINDGTAALDERMP